MQLIDTHTHIYLPEFDDDRDMVVNRAVENGIVRLLMPNIDIDSTYRMLSAGNRYQGICSPMIGLHPTSVKEDFISQIDKLESMTASYKFCAIGEIGIDLYWDHSNLEKQLEAFRRQVTFAIVKGLPVVIHSRNSFPEVFMALEEFIGSGVKGVFHAFSGSVKEAEKAIGMGFKLGIGGIVTFKNSGLDKVVKEIGAENIVLETDSPYLAPMPHRGKRNESSYLRLINNKLSEILSMSEEEIARITFDNSSVLFNLAE
jgi:TatD DNase family protein